VRVGVTVSPCSFSCGSSNIVCADSASTRRIAIRVVTLVRRPPEVLDEVVEALQTGPESGKPGVAGRRAAMIRTRSRCRMGPKPAR
jgi:hypothetical protein